MRTRIALLSALFCSLALWHAQTPIPLPAQTAAAPPSAVWEALPSPAGGSVSHIAVTPGQPWDGRLFAAVRGRGIYRVPNQGKEWLRTGSGDWDVQDLQLSPAFAADQTLFALTGSPQSGYVVRRSADGGATWSSSAVFANGLALSVSPNFAADQTLYLLTGADHLTWRSTDGGHSFAPVGGWWSERDVSVLVFSPTFDQGHTIFAGVVGSGLYRSTDSGASWDLVLAGDVRLAALPHSFAIEGIALAIGGTGVLWRSADFGVSWTPIGAFTLGSPGRFSAAFSPTFATDRVVMVASSADPGPWRSMDGGLTWETAGWYTAPGGIGSGLIGGGVQALALTPNQTSYQGVAYAATRTGVAESSNAGAAWLQMNRGLPTLAVRALAEDSLNPQANTRLVLAGSAYFEQSRFDSDAPIPDSGAIYRSLDGGRAWYQISGRLPRLNAVVLSPNFSVDNTAFAAAGMVGQHGFVEGDLYRSTDGGQQWSAVSPISAAYTAVAFSPNFAADHTIWAAAQGASTAVGLYHSTDGGDAWTLIAPGLDVATLAVSPNYARDQTLFVGTGGAGLQRSHDGGLTWIPVLPNLQVTALAVSPIYGASRTLYAAARSQAGDPTILYRSTDGGESWQTPDAAIPPQQDGQPLTVTTLAWAADGSLLAGGQYGHDGVAAVYRSVDGARSWQATGGLPAGMSVYQLLTKSEQTLTLQAATSSGLRAYTLLQAGPPEPGNWLSSGPYGGHVHTLAVSPNFVADGLAFAGERWLDLSANGVGVGVRKSADYGRTWVASSAGMANMSGSAAVHGYAFSPAFAADQTLFAATWGGLFHSTDAGQNWTLRPVSGSAGANHIISVAVAPDFPTSGHIAAIIGYPLSNSRGQLWLSRDGGYTWTLPGNWPTAAGAVSVVVYSPAYAQDQTIFASGENGVWRSRDGGATWNQVHAESITTLLLSPDYAHDRTFWGGSDFLHIFLDDGATWISHPVGESDYVLSLAVSPDYAHDQTLFAGTDRGLYYSTNSGLDWTAAPEYAGQTISRLAISPGWPAHPILLVGTPEGVFRVLTADFSGGGVVREASQPLAVLEATGLALAPDESTLLVGTVTQGIFAGSDRGYTWRALNWCGYFPAGAMAVSTADTAGQTIFVALYSSKSPVNPNSGVYRSEDGGETWTTVAGGLPVNNLALSPNYTTDGVVFRTVEGFVGSWPHSGLYYSNDRGATWSSLGDWHVFVRGLARRIALTPDYTTDRRLLVGSSNGFWFSHDHGITWTQASSGLVDRHAVNRLVVSPNFSVDNTLLAVADWRESSYGYTHSGDIFRSVNGGVDWTVVIAGIPTAEAVQDVTFSPHFAADQTAYALTDRALYRSRDGGVSWASVGALPADGPWRALQMDSEGNVFLAGAAGVWRYITLFHNLIINGRCEGAGGWTLANTPIPAQYDRQVVYNGQTALKLGLDNADNRYGYSSARQQIRLPETTLQATLTFHLYPAADETGAAAAPAALLSQGRRLDGAQSTAGDAQYVLLLDPETADVLQILHWGLSNAQMWQRHTITLPTEYAGRSLLLHFGVFNDGVGGRTTLYVDDVSLTVLDGALAPHHINLPVLLR